MSRIIPRSEWGARRSDGFANRAVGSLRKYLHHTVTATLPVSASVAQERAQMRALEDIGQSRFGGGVSYTFIVFPSGRIYQGHSIGRVGAHTRGQNNVAAGIALAGNFETATPTPQMQAAIVWLLQEGVRRKWWGDPALTGGHRDAPGASTACPGRYAYALIPSLNSRARGGAVAPPSGGSEMSFEQTWRGGKLAARHPKEGFGVPEQTPAQRLTTTVERAGRALVAIRETRTIAREIRALLRGVFDTTWRSARLAARHPDREYGLPEQNPAQRLTTAAEYSRRGVVIGRRIETELAALTAAVRVLAESQGVDPDRVESVVREGVDAALADVSITLSVERED